MESLSRIATSRRGFVQAAAGLGLSFMLPGLNIRAAERRGGDRKKSLLTIWLGGGASQLETWDPHPDGPIGGEVQAISTSLPGLQIADLFPQVAEQIHNVSVIRSMVSKEGDHERGTYFLKTGYRPDPTVTHPSLGSIYACEKPRSELEIPAHVSLASGQWAPRGGYLGDEFDAFKIYDPGRNVQNLKMHVPEERQQRRLANLKVVSAAFRTRRKPQVDNTLHQATIQRALQMMSSEQLVAFEIDDEPKAVKDAYGDNRFGRGCLVARRLIEQGVQSIEVALNGWDTHANNHSGHVQNSAMLDPALATLLKELAERDLLQSTVVMCIGEFGRTPSINPLGGRDHWPSGFSCLIGGGGIRQGAVIGATDKTGEKKQPENPIEVQDLYSTILKVLDIDHSKQIMTPISRPIALSQGKPIQELLV